MLLARCIVDEPDVLLVPPELPPRERNWVANYDPAKVAALIAAGAQVTRLGQQETHVGVVIND